MLVLPSHDTPALKAPTPADHKDKDNQSRYLDTLYRFEDQRRRPAMRISLISRPLEPEEMRVLYGRAVSPGLDF